MKKFVTALALSVVFGLGLIAQTGYLFTVSPEISDSALIRITDSSGDGTVTVAQARSLIRTPIETQPPVGETCTANAYKPGYDPIPYVRSTAYTNLGLSIANQIVPRNLSGNPDPNGVKLFLGAGMSSAKEPQKIFANLYANDVQRVSDAKIIQVAQSGKVLKSWENPLDSAYIDAIQWINQKGYSQFQVAGIWMISTSAWPATEGGYMTKERLVQMAYTLQGHFPNLKMLYLSEHYATHYTDDPTLGSIQNKVPYWNTFNEHVMMADVETINWPSGMFVDFKTNYSNGATPNPVTGLAVTCADFELDRHHPYDDVTILDNYGRAKFGRFMLDQIKADPTSWGWLFQGQ